MKQIPLYVCDFCDFESRDPEETYAHEAKHYGLSTDEYKQYQKLALDAKNASHAVTVCNNAHWRHNEEKALKALMDFEKAHDMTDPMPVQKGDR